MEETWWEGCGERSVAHLPKDSGSQKHTLQQGFPCWASKKLEIPKSHLLGALVLQAIE